MYPPPGARPRSSFIISLGAKVGLTHEVQNDVWKRLVPDPPFVPPVSSISFGTKPFWFAQVWYAAAAEGEECIMNLVYSFGMTS